MSTEKSPHVPLCLDAPDWNSLAADDSRQVPEFLLLDTVTDFSEASLSTDRYVCPDFFRKEVEHMWPHVWQYAAREEDLPAEGDFVVYENVGRSYLIVRQSNGTIRAFHNVCLHRGRKLRTESGSATEFKCPFHGFSWRPDGALKTIPCRWDFPHLRDADMALPEVSVATWGGYVFIRESAGGPSLEEFLDPIPHHFERWWHERRYTSAWVAKVVPANWKATAEAFMEAYHVIATHPQIMPFTGDANSKYAVYGDHVNLAITPFGIKSPHLAALQLEEQAVMDAFLKNNGRVVPAGESIKVEEGSSTRIAMGKFNRKRFSIDSGVDLDHASDAELQDALTYNVFPNFSPWGGFGPAITYRWRPWPDQDHTLMEVRLLTLINPGKPVPRSEPMRMLADHEKWADALGVLGGILDQDMANLPHVQTGMKSSANKQVQLGNYQEVRIRHFHQTLDKYLAQAMPGQNPVAGR